MADPSSAVVTSPSSLPSTPLHPAPESGSTAPSREALLRRLESRFTASSRPARKPRARFSHRPPQRLGALVAAAPETPTLRQPILRDTLATLDAIAPLGEADRDHLKVIVERVREVLGEIDDGPMDIAPYEALFTEFFALGGILDRLRRAAQLDPTHSRTCGDEAALARFLLLREQLDLLRRRGTDSQLERALLGARGALAGVWEALSEAGWRRGQLRLADLPLPPARSAELGRGTLTLNALLLLAERELNRWTNLADADNRKHLADIRASAQRLASYVAAALATPLEDDGQAAAPSLLQDSAHAPLRRAILHLKDQLTALHQLLPTPSKHAKEAPRTEAYPVAPVSMDAFLAAL